MEKINARKLIQEFELKQINPVVISEATALAKPLQSLH